MCVLILGSLVFKEAVDLLLYVMEHESEVNCFISIFVRYTNTTFTSIREKKIIVRPVTYISRGGLDITHWYHEPLLCMPAGISRFAWIQNCSVG